MHQRVGDERQVLPEALGAKEWNRTRKVRASAQHEQHRSMHSSLRV